MRRMMDVVQSREHRYSFHLFCGAGGGVLADLLGGKRVLGAVEIEEHPRRVLLQRMQDGVIERFPIWDDVCTFRRDNPETGEFIERELDPIRDELCISGGFPCQDISVAGKGKGIEGERSGLWSEMFRIIGEVRPAFVFVENSPALITRGGIRVVNDLASIGYNFRWTSLGADEVQAPHKRARFWGFGIRNT